MSRTIELDIRKSSWKQTIEEEVLRLHDSISILELRVNFKGEINENIVSCIDHIVDDLNQIGSSFHSTCIKGSCIIIERCERCLQLREGKSCLPSQEKYYLFLHIHISTLCYGVHEKKHSPGSKLERKRFVRKLQRFISALRNTNGGAILIHIADLAEGDKYLDYFNELVDDKLHDMIDDGRLFADVYKKSWLSDLHPGVVQIVVRPTSLLSTLDYCTKLSLDNKIVDPLSQTIFHFLKSSRTFIDLTPKLLGLDEIHESRKVQVKSLNKVIEDNPDVVSSAEVFSQYVWNELRLKDYISAFSKIDGGGSYYVGIAENDKKYDLKKHSYKYKSKEYTVQGFTCRWIINNQTFKSIIQNKLYEETLVLKYDGKVEKTPKSTIDLVFHELGRHTYVLEVGVAAINGLMFYDTKGPESYELTKDNKIRRFQPNEWFIRLQEIWKRGSSDQTEDDSSDEESND